MAEVMLLFKPIDTSAKELPIFQTSTQIKPASTAIYDPERRRFDQPLFCASNL